MKAQSFGFIGGGRITRLLLQALKKRNSLPRIVLVSDTNEQMKEKVQAIDAGIVKCVNSNVDVLNVDILFLAVHPPVMKEIAAEISGKLPANTLVVSLIPVISLKKLSEMLGGIKKLIRMIPNASSIIHKGYNPVVFSKELSMDEVKMLKQIFVHWGEAPEVEEHKLESYAIVTAMGPTYFWSQWLKLRQLGGEFGLSDPELKKALPSMLHGATETLFESDLPSNEVLDLIPVCPLKEDEPVIEQIFDKKLNALYEKLTKK